MNQKRKPGPGVTQPPPTPRRSMVFKLDPELVGTVTLKDIEVEVISVNLENRTIKLSRRERAALFIKGLEDRELPCKQGINLTNLQLRTKVRVNFGHLREVEPDLKYEVTPKTEVIGIPR